MFGFYISLPFLFFALYRLFIVLYNYFSRPYLPKGNPTELPLVSILISDLRDEITTKTILNSLLNQSYRNIEILVFTYKENKANNVILQEYLAKDQRIRLIDGIDVPDGWNKSNFIRDYLFQQSRGQFIVFVESNVSAGNELIANALSYMQLNGLSLLTLLPIQITASQLNRMQFSIRYWLILTLTPIERIIRSKSESLAVNSSQFMMFESTSYKANRWHEKYKSFGDIDFVIGRLVKKSNLRMATLLCNSEIIFESSQNEPDSSKSFIFNFFGRNNTRLILYTFASTLGFVFAIFLLPFPLFFLYLFSIFFARMLFSSIVGSSILLSILLLPIHHFVFLFTVINHIRNQKKSSK
ncbi:MAG: hypothetical protein AB9846_14555 [Tenuifilaceae bacterium]